MIRPPGINYSTPITMEVLESTFHEHYEGLHRYAYSLTGDNETAKDVVQQVFTTLWEKRDQLTITNSLRAYLYRAVHNACHNLTTRTIRHQPVEKLKEEDLGYPGVQPEFLREIRELEAIIRATIPALHDVGESCNYHSTMVPTWTSSGRRSTSNNITEQSIL